MKWPLALLSLVAILAMILLVGVLTLSSFAQTPPLTVTPTSTPDCPVTPCQWETPAPTPTLTPGCPVPPCEMVIPTSTPDCPVPPCQTDTQIPTPTAVATPTIVSTYPPGGVGGGAGGGGGSGTIPSAMPSPIATPRPELSPIPTAAPTSVIAPTLEPASTPALTIAPTPAPTETQVPTTPTVTPTPTPIAGVIKVPWSLIGGISVAVLAAGSIFFFVMRSRTAKDIKEGPKFLIVGGPPASEGGAGKEMWYILSEGRVIKVTPGEDCSTESK